MGRCLEKAGSSSMGERRNQLVQEDDTQSITSHISKIGPVVDGENLMLRRTLLKMPSVVEPPQRKNLFKRTCRSYRKICKVIVDSRSTKNIVSTKKVDKIKLRRIPHATPYKVSWLNKG